MESNCRNKITYVQYRPYEIIIDKTTKYVMF